MKFLLLLVAASRYAAGFPHGPDEDEPPAIAPAGPAGLPTAVPPQASVPVVPNPATTSVPVSPKAKTTTPAGCRKLDTDVDWPTEAQWKQALPGIIKRSTTLPKGVRRPDYRFRAEKYADVQAAVKFCAKNNIRLTIINSGHDFLGRNDAPSGLSLDVSLLRGIKLLEDFTPTATGAARPQGAVNTIVPVAGKRPAVTFGVGISTQTLHNAVNPSKLMTIGAAHGSVAVAGGFGQTAGHGPMGPLYGLGADQFLEFKVVTADGALRVANKVANPDLFWALRGGGGSTFGVVVEATVKAHPDVVIDETNWWFNSTGNDNQGLWDAYAYLHTQFEDLSTKGFSGYYYIYPTSMRAVILAGGAASGPARSKAIWDPILKKMASFPNMSEPRKEYQHYETYKDYFDTRFGPIDKKHMSKRHGPGSDMSKPPEPQGIIGLDSRLLGAKHFKNPNLSKYLKDASPVVLGKSVGGLQGHFVAGGKVSHPDDDTAVLPAWRTALVHLIGTRSATSVGVQSLRELSPESGAYANEAFPQEVNWKKTFWGTNYPKLSQLKSKYDPNMLFWVTPGINADLMEAREERVCKVTKPRTESTPPKGDNRNSPLLMKGSIN